MHAMLRLMPADLAARARHRPGARQRPPRARASVALADDASSTRSAAGSHGRGATAPVADGVAAPADPRPERRTLTVLVLGRQGRPHARSCACACACKVEGREHVPQPRPGDPRVEPPFVPRLDLHPARRAPPRHVRGQGRVLRRPEDRVVLPRLSARSRSGARAAARASARSRRRPRCCARASVFGIYPEGTRTRDGFLHRGHTGVARLALRRQRADRAGRPDRHRRGAAGRLADAAAVPPRDDPLRRADRPRALRAAASTTAWRCASSPTR